MCDTSKYNSNYIPVVDSISTNRPEIVCLIGSSRFMEQHIEAMKKLTLEGKIVIGMGMFGHNEPGFDMDGPIKKMLDELHLRKVDLCDTVFVVNHVTTVCSKCGKYSPESRIYTDSDCCKSPKVYRAYIGESTKRELEYARKYAKTILSLNTLEE